MWLLIVMIGCNEEGDYVALKSIVENGVVRANLIEKMKRALPWCLRNLKIRMYVSSILLKLSYVQEDDSPGLVVSANSTKINLLFTICSSIQLDESDKVIPHIFWIRNTTKELRNKFTSV